MVEPAAAAEAVDPASVRCWMRDAGIDLDGGINVERVGLGHSNLTYRVSDESGQSWVLRRPPLGALLDSAHDVLREARILRGLEATDVPVPHILGTLAPGQVGDNVPAVLMSWVDGIVVDRASVIDGLTPPWRRAAALSLIGGMAAIHAVDPTRVGLGDLASRAPFAARQLRRWSRQWQSSRTRELPELDRLTERLQTAVPMQQETTIVHGDLHMRNVIFSAETGAPNAILDWELSTLGEPLADLGMLLACWPSEGEPSLEERPASTHPGFPTRSEMVDAYAETTGRDLSAVAYWYALSLWKLAIIGEGILRRNIDEPRNRSSSGAATPQSVAALVARAHVVLDELMT